jgi:hypothetical protein
MKKLSILNNEYQFDGALEMIIVSYVPIENLSETDVNKLIYLYVKDKMPIHIKNEILSEVMSDSYKAYDYEDKLRREIMDIYRSRKNFWDYEHCCPMSNSDIAHYADKHGI